MNKISLIAAFAVAAALAGCGKESSTGSASSTPAAAPATQQPVSIEAIAAEGQGFTVGSPMSVRTVYVFFDAQCPHCKALWNEMKPLKSQVKVVWMPVRLLADLSETQGATILSAADPVATMEDHESKLTGHGTGIAAGDNLDAARAKVKKNTELFNRYGFNSVPTIVAKHGVSGQLVVKEGALPTAELAAFLGVQAPAAATAASHSASDGHNHK